MRWPWMKTRTDAKPEQARKKLEETRAQWPEVRELVAELREHRRRNHFAENVFRMGGSR